MWLALSGAIYLRIALSFALNRIFSQPMRMGQQNKITNQIWRLFQTNQSHCRKMKDKKSHFLANLAIKLCDFKMDPIKWQLNWGECNFGLYIILVISNQTPTARSFDFAITSMISDQIALHSVQLTLQIYFRSITNFVFWLVTLLDHYLFAEELSADGFPAEISCS